MGIQMPKQKIDVVKMMKQAELKITFHIKRLKELRLRIWIGTQLIKLASKIINCGIKFEKDQSCG